MVVYWRPCGATCGERRRTGVVGDRHDPVAVLACDRDSSINGTGAAGRIGTVSLLGAVVTDPIGHGNSAAKRRIARSTNRKNRVLRIPAT
jgi:hypothetical protein